MIYRGVSKHQVIHRHVPLAIHPSCLKTAKRRNSIVRARELSVIKKGSSNNVVYKMDILRLLLPPRQYDHCFGRYHFFPPPATWPASRVPSLGVWKYSADVLVTRSIGSMRLPSLFHRRKRDWDEWIFRSLTGHCEWPVFFFFKKKKTKKQLSLPP